MSDIRIVMSDRCHSAGIEYNYLPTTWEADCVQFAAAVKTFCGHGWFWQTGDQKKGYQFVEGLGVSEDEVLETAIQIAKALQANIVI